MNHLYSPHTLDFIFGMCKVLNLSDCYVNLKPLTTSLWNISLHCVFERHFSHEAMMFQVQYHCDASVNLGLGNRNPISNLHFQGKLSWHSNLFPNMRVQMITTL